MFFFVCARDHSDQIEQILFYFKSLRILFKLTENFQTISIFQDLKKQVFNQKNGFFKRRKKQRENLKCQSNDKFMYNTVNNRIDRCLLHLREKENSVGDDKRNESERMNLMKNWGTLNKIKVVGVLLARGLRLLSSPLFPLFFSHSPPYYIRISQPNL